MIHIFSVFLTHAHSIENRGSDEGFAFFPLFPPVVACIGCLGNCHSQEGTGCALTLSGAETSVVAPWISAPAPGTCAAPLGTRVPHFQGVKLYISLLAFLQFKRKEREQEW